MPFLNELSASHGIIWIYIYSQQLAQSNFRYCYECHHFGLGLNKSGCLYILHNIPTAGKSQFDTTAPESLKKQIDQYRTNNDST